MSDKLSVALSTYNGEKFIEKQLDSILNQTMPVHEIVICDDCSTDQTIVLLEKISALHPGILQIHINPFNHRSVKNFEKAIGLCTGDFIFLSDQDDLWHPQKVEKIISHFRENPSAEGVFTDAALIDDEGQPLGDVSLWELSFFSPALVKKFNNFWKVFQVHQNMVTGATFSIKKSAKEFIFPFPLLYYFHHDEWIALHLAQRHSLHCLEDRLTLYRIHSSQQVGDGMVKRFEKEKAHAAWAWQIEEPESFTTYFKQYKRAYFIYLKFHDLKRIVEFSSLDLDQLMQGSIDNFNAIGKRIGRKYPIRFTVKRLLDRVRDKRQIRR